MNCCSNKSCWNNCQRNDFPTKIVQTILVGTVVPTIIIGTAVPTMTLGTKISFLGTVVPTYVVGTTSHMTSLKISQFKYKTPSLDFLGSEGVPLGRQVGISRTFSIVSFRIITRAGSKVIDLCNLYLS